MIFTKSVFAIFETALNWTRKTPLYYEISFYPYAGYASEKCFAEWSNVRICMINIRHMRK